MRSQVMRTLLSALVVLAVVVMYGFVLTRGRWP